MKHILVSKELNQVEDQESAVEFLQRNVEKTYSYQLIYPADGKYKVDEIKSFTKKLSIRQNAHTESVCFVLMKSDTMSAICQNALLKVLEETEAPILLVTKNVDSLLPTIRSRTQIMYLGGEIESSQPDQDEITSESIARISKLERDKVRIIFENRLSQPKVSYDEVELIEHTIKMIDANCKIESVLFDYLYKLDRIRKNK